MVQVLPYGRSYCFIYGGRISAVIKGTCFALQGLVLGPLLFILYTADLADVASKFGVKLHAFTDDNQLHVHCDLSNVLSSVNVLEQCVTAIGDWISANRLKLNAEKTELMSAGTRYTIASFSCLHNSTMTVGTDDVKAAYWNQCVLGVLFMLDLALENHVMTVPSVSFSSDNCIVCDVRSTMKVQLR